MAAPKNFTTVLLSAASTSLKSSWLDVSGCGMLTMTVRAIFTAATLQGVLSFQATSNAVEDATEPLLVNGVQIGGGTITGMTFAAATGVTFNNPTTISPAINTLVISFPTFPQKVLANWAFGSGGGTVSLIVTAAGWTV